MANYWKQAGKGFVVDEVLLLLKAIEMLLIFKMCVLVKREVGAWGNIQALHSHCKAQKSWGEGELSKGRNKLGRKEACELWAGSNLCLSVCVRTKMGCVCVCVRARGYVYSCLCM